jgi:hypothetical protein
MWASKDHSNVASSNRPTVRVRPFGARMASCESGSGEFSGSPTFCEACYWPCIVGPPLQERRVLISQNGYQRQKGVEQDLRDCLLAPSTYIHRPGHPRHLCRPSSPHIRFCAQRTRRLIESVNGNEEPPEFWGEVQPPALSSRCSDVARRCIILAPVSYQVETFAPRSDMPRLAANSSPAPEAS